MAQPTRLSACIYPSQRNGAQFQVVARITASNVSYAVTSSVAVLTVHGDTNPPIASYNPRPVRSWWD